MNTRKLWIVLLALVLALWSVTPVLAQEATAEAPEEAAPVDVTVEDGGTVNIDTPDDGAGLNSISVVVGALVVFVIGIVVAVVVRGTPVDSAATERLETLRMNNAAMSEMRQFVRDTSDVNRRLLGTVETIVKAVAPLTPATSDDALGRFLDDLTPDEPPAGSMNEPHR